MRYCLYVVPVTLTKQKLPPKAYKQLAMAVRTVSLSDVTSKGPYKSVSDVITCPGIGLTWTRRCYDGVKTDDPKLANANLVCRTGCNELVDNEKNNVKVSMLMKYLGCSVRLTYHSIFFICIVNITDTIHSHLYTFSQYKIANHNL